MRIEVSNESGMSHSRMAGLHHAFGVAQSVLGLDKVRGIIHTHIVRGGPAHWCPGCGAYHDDSGKMGLALIKPGYSPKVRLVDFGRDEQLHNTLAHEFTHVRDAMNGRLEACARGCKWEGRYYGPEWDHPPLYRDAPWEISARAGAEQVMFALNHNGMRLAA